MPSVAKELRKVLTHEWASTDAIRVALAGTHPKKIAPPITTVRRHLATLRMSLEVECMLDPVSRSKWGTVTLWRLRPAP